MQKFALVFRSHFALVAFFSFFACVSCAGCNLGERAQNVKINKECNNYLNQSALKLLGLQTNANSETEPEKFLAGVGDIYAELLDNLRSLDASGCSPEYRNALDDFIAYIEKLANLSQELQTLQRRLTSGEGEAETILADAQRMIQIGEEFESLANRIDAETNKLKAAM